MVISVAKVLQSEYFPYYQSIQFALVVISITKVPLIMILAVA